MSSHWAFKYYKKIIISLWMILMIHAGLTSVVPWPVSADMSNSEGSLSVINLNGTSAVTV